MVSGDYFVVMVFRWIIINRKAVTKACIRKDIT